MYNLTVEEAHTFFVGEDGWLVHNITCSWPEGIPISEKGQKLADIADEAHDSAFFTHTAGAVEVGGTVYIAVNGGASSTIKNKVQAWASKNGYIYLDNNLTADTLPNNLTSNHAEQFLYHHFGGNIDIIGASGEPCPGCQRFFTPDKGVQIVYNNNRKKG